MKPLSISIDLLCSLFPSLPSESAKILPTLKKLTSYVTSMVFASPGVCKPDNLPVYFGLAVTLPVIVPANPAKQQADFASF